MTCIKFRADRNVGERRERETNNKLVAYQEDFSRRVNDLEGAIDVLQTMLENTVTTANMDRLEYDETVAMISERVEVVKDEYETTIQQLSKNNRELAAETRKREAQLLQKLKDTERELTNKLKKREAQLKLEFAKERAELMGHVGILEQQVEIIEQAADTAVKIATQHKIESGTVINAKDLEIEGLKQMRDAMNVQIDDLETMVDGVTTQCMEIANCVDVTDKKCVQLEKDKEHHLRRIKDLEEMLSDVKNRAAAALKQVLERAVTQQDRVISLEKEVQTLTSEHAQLQQTQEATTAAHEESKNEVAQLSLLHQTIEQQKAQMKKLKITVNGLNGEVKTWQVAAEKAKMQAESANSLLQTQNSLPAPKVSTLPVVSAQSTKSKSGEDSPQLSEIDSDVDLELDFDIDMDIGTEGLDLDKPLSDLD